MRSNIKDIVGRSLKPTVRHTFWIIAEIMDVVLNRRDELIPPRRLVPYGVCNYREIGAEFVNYFINLAGLKPNETVLDIGCGTGRIAIPLTVYLAQGGSYEGVEIIQEAVDWCKLKISANRSNFHFHLADIYNARYNPKGRIKASHYRFPFDNDHFDFVFLASVFTHMLEEDVENYVSEISRLLKPQGRCLLSLFLWNAESSAFIETRQSSLHFRYRFRDCWTIDPCVPEAAVAYEEGFICAMFEKYGLLINRPIRYGSWCGRSDYLSYQDIVILIKEKEASGVASKSQSIAEG